MLTSLEHFSRQFCKWLALLGLVGLVALALVTIADVMMRWLFSDPIDGVSDVYRLLIAIVVASFFPSAFAERGHIAIRFLSAVLPPRGRKVLAGFAALGTLVFTCVLGWQFILYSMEVYETGETTWLLGLSVTPWWIIATGFLLLCIPVQLIVLLADIATGENPPASGHADAANHSSSTPGMGV